MIWLITLAALQLQIPEPIGFVNDFAGVIHDRDERLMSVIIDEVRRNHAARSSSSHSATSTGGRGWKWLEISVERGEWAAWATPAIPLEMRA